MKHIPNILSFGRIGLIPIIIWQYSKGNHLYAALWLAISGLTDLLDGALARKFGWVTQLGKVLDPVADKLTLLSVSVLLAIKLQEYRIFFVILLIKDGIMMILGGYLVKNGVTLDGSKWFGKVATVVFYIAMVGLWIFDVPHGAVLVILSIVTALEVLSALLYIPDYKEYRKQHPKYQS